MGEPSQEQPDAGGSIIKEGNQRPIRRRPLAATEFHAPPKPVAPAIGPDRVAAQSAPDLISGREKLCPIECHERLAGTGRWNRSIEPGASQGRDKSSPADANSVV